MRGLAITLVASIVLVGCNRRERAASCDPATQRCDCATVRRLPDSSCCPSWTRYERGKCVARVWRAPKAGEGLGDHASSPDVAVGADGRVSLVWVSGDSVSSEVVVAEESTGGWRLRQPSRAVGGHAMGPRLAVGPRGEAIVTWHAATSGLTAVYRATRDASGAWTEPSGPHDTVSFPSNAYDATAYIRPDGEALHVWNQITSAGHHGVAVARRAPAESDFNRPRDSDDVLSPLVLYANRPEVAANDEGDVLITWYQSAGKELLTFASERFGSAGTFSQPGPADALSPAATPVENPSPAVAADGRAAVAWRQEIGKGKMAIFLATRDRQRVWHKPGALSASFTKPVDFAWNNRTAFTPGGDLYVVWQQKEGDDQGIFAAHQRADGTWAADGRNPIRLSAGGVVAFDPWLAVGEDEEVVVVWTQHAGGEFLVVARISASDAAGKSEDERWSATTVLSQRGRGNAGKPRVAIAGGRAVATWTQAGQVWTASID